MGFELKDGTGTGNKAQVDGNNQIHVLAVTDTAIQDAVVKGNAYNINTGTIGLTTSTASAVLYFKNDESPVNGESSIIVDAIAVGIGDGGTKDEKAVITVIKNPTTGTIIDNATAVDMKVNRNFGSSNELSSTSLAYKGAEGYTFTNGTDFAQFYQTGTRGYYNIDTRLGKGSSIGVKIDTQTSAGTTDVYVALIFHRVDGKNRG